MMMDGAGHQFLAGAAFAGDQDAGFAELLEAADIVKDPPQVRAFADESMETPALGFEGVEGGKPLVGFFPGLFSGAPQADFGFQLGIALLQLAGQAAELEVGGHPGDDFFSLKWFFDVIHGTHSEPVDHKFGFPGLVMKITGMSRVSASAFNSRQT